MKIKLTILSLILSLGTTPVFAGQSTIDEHNAESVNLPQATKMIPPILSKYHYGNEVVLEFTVQEDGTVANIKPEKRYWEIEQIEIASKMANVLKQWSFKPGTDSNGQVIPTRVRMPVIVSSEGISLEGYRLMDSISFARSESDVASSAVDS